MLAIFMIRGQRSFDTISSSKSIVEVCFTKYEYLHLLLCLRALPRLVAVLSHVDVLSVAFCALVHSQ